MILIRNYKKISFHIMVAQFPVRSLAEPAGHHGIRVAVYNGCGRKPRLESQSWFDRFESIGLSDCANLRPILESREKPGIARNRQIWCRNASFLGLANRACWTRRHSLQRCCCCGQNRFFVNLAKKALFELRKVCKCRQWAVPKLIIEIFDSIKVEYCSRRLWKGSLIRRPQSMF